MASIKNKINGWELGFQWYRTLPKLLMLQQWSVFRSWDSKTASTQRTMRRSPSVKSAASPSREHQQRHQFQNRGTYCMLTARVGFLSYVLCCVISELWRLTLMCRMLDSMWQTQEHSQFPLPVLEAHIVIMSYE
jgi:hypothetical protein